MPSLNTQITPPRVAFLDPRTGAVSREWYMFFLSLYQLTAGSDISLDDVQKGPPLVTESITGQLSELEKALDGLLSQPEPEIGTMAHLQQSNVPWLTFDTTPEGVPATTPGTAFWGPSNSLNLHHGDGVTQPIGLVSYSQAVNTTGVTISRGQVVSLSGVGTGSPVGVRLFLADGTIPALYILGIAAHPIEAGTPGFVTARGIVTEIDTTGTPVGETWLLNDILYGHPTIPGALTKVKPTSPNVVVPISLVVTVHATLGAMAVRPAIGQRFAYGEFHKTVDATPSAINTANTIPLDSTLIANGLSIGAPASRIVAAVSGLYDFSVQLQMTSGSASVKRAWFWFRKNGVDIPSSATVVTISGSNVTVAPSIEVLVSLNASDYVELVWAADDVAVTLDTTPPTGFAPQAPGVVMVVTQDQQ